MALPRRRVGGMACCAAFTTSSNFRSPLCGSGSLPASSGTDSRKESRKLLFTASFTFSGSEPVDASAALALSLAGIRGEADAGDLQILVDAASKLA